MVGQVGKNLFVTTAVRVITDRTLAVTFFTGLQDGCRSCAPDAVSGLDSPTVYISNDDMGRRVVSYLMLSAVAALVVQTSWLPAHMIENHCFAAPATAFHDHDKHAHDHDHHGHEHEHEDVDDGDRHSHEQHPASDHANIDGRLAASWQMGSAHYADVPERRCIDLPTFTDEEPSSSSHASRLSSQTERRFAQSRAPPTV